MKRIAVVTSGLLPMPSVRGGAIETLLQMLIDYNEQEQFCSLDIFSIYDEKAAVKARGFNNASFRYIKTNSAVSRASNFLCRVLRKSKILDDPNFIWQFSNKVSSRLKQGNYDAIIVESENHIAYKLLRDGHKNIILYLHNDKLNNGTKHAKEIIKGVRGVLVISDYLKKRVATIDENADQKVTVIHNGIIEVNFSRQLKRDVRSSKRRELGIDSNDIVYLFCGRIQPEKGTFELIEAFSRLKYEHSKLLIVGASFYDTGKKTRYIKKMELYISKYPGLKEKIIFTGYIPQEHVGSIYRLADVQVIPSTWQEPLGLVCIEGMFSQLPIIASNSGGIPECLASTRAVLVDLGAGFTSRLANAMLLLGGDKHLRDEIVASQSMIMHNFTAKTYCEKLATYIQENT